MVFVGAEYEADEEIRFDEIFIRFPDLDVWALFSGFGYEMHWHPEGKSVTKFDLSYTPPEAIEIALDDDTTLSITWSWRWSGTEEVTTEARLGQTASFKVSLVQAATLDRQGVTPTVCRLPTIAGRCGERE